ncbi:MAG TPA: 2-oxoglutarate dehydrogenase E1 component [Gemmatimonadaceae bacterium]|nr:2-oxoglutarate dehydrogenase E1 component [Gemmatimonadaceae bacterium]
MSSLPITSAFNDGYVAELYERFQRDPSSVDASWRQFFEFAQSLGGGAQPTVATASALRKVAGAAGLVQAIRQYGHLAVQLDPLGTAPLGAKELTPEFHGISEEDLRTIPGAALWFEDDTALAAVNRLRALYSGTMGFEFEHIEEQAEREWFREQIEGGQMARVTSAEQKMRLLQSLTAVDALEKFLGRTFLGVKRFSVEGNDALIPMIDQAVERAAQHGTRQVVVGMAHRGRINVLAHVLEKPMGTIFNEFEGRPERSDAEDTGDVKYHLGARIEREMPGGTTVEVMLLPNPSHLEFVNPVLEGVARALQRPDEQGARDEASVLPVVVHGDAAFPGEGVVAETFNLSALGGYRTGGTLHIIANNQVGFTTDPRDGRSTYYASDLAKGFEVPIVHVNGDDAEGAITALWLAIEYRARFKKDFLIDLVGYRRHGHNETDEPAYTQPKLYDLIRAHPAPREVYARRLADEGVITADDAQRLFGEAQQRLQSVYNELKAGRLDAPEHVPGDQSAAKAPASMDTAVDAATLADVNEQLLNWPESFHAHPKLAKQFERRREALGEAGGIEWGHAEALAWGSLLLEGTSVRISGQDTERGTFSHRQAVLHDVETGEKYIPLEHLRGARGRFEIYNSPLSEVAVLAFEYGYSVAAPDTLVLWEAQFGDFVNVAQPVIDQFLAADRAKWGQNSGVVLLLPHGYEGQGPEHSSARLERFLQLAAEGNMRIAYPTTPGQYFHILRRQAKLDERRPLVLMQPKSLLRAPQAASRLAEMTTGGFQAVLDDTATSPEDVRRIVFVSGKLYYDLVAKEHPPHVALVRVEELYPWPHDDIARVVSRYPSLEEIVWAQEEPKNMGAWSFVAPRLLGTVGRAPRYVGRPERASPAEGYLSAHQEQQGAIVAEALEPIAARRTAEVGK